MTTTKIAGGNVTLDKLADGTTNNNIIRWNATTTQWEETNLATGLGENVESTDGSITGGQNSAALVAMDLGVNVDNSTLEIDPTDGVQIANGGVTTDEILDGTIATDDIANDAVTTTKIAPSGTDGEILTTTTGGAVSWQPPAVVAMGKVDASLSPVNTKLSGAAVTHPSTGNYTVTFDTARPDSNYIIQLTLYGAPTGSTIQVQNQTTTGFDVVIVSTQPNFNPASPTFTTDSGGSTPHTHTGIVDTFLIVDNLIFLQQDASWYFTITDF